MVISYTLHTPSQQDAQAQALTMAKSQGFRTASILSIDQTESGVYQISLQVTK